MKAVLALLIACGCIAAACGGGDENASPEEHEYFSGLQSIQQQANEAAGQIPALDDVGIGDGIDDAEAATIDRFFDVTRAIHAAIGEALRTMRPPAELREAHFAYVDAVARARDIAQEARDAIGDRDAIAGSLSGLVRATTEAARACDELQREADEREVGVNLLCG